MSDAELSDASTIEADDEEMAYNFEIGVYSDQESETGALDEEEECDDDTEEADVDEEVEDEDRDSGEGEEEYFLKRRPDLMTSRQRTILERQHEDKSDGFLSTSGMMPPPNLPLGSSQYTEEELVKRKRRAMRRRELSRDKAEKEKKMTVDRLLKISSGVRSLASAASSSASMKRGRPSNSHLGNLQQQLTSTATPGDDEENQKSSSSNHSRSQRILPPGTSIRYYSGPTGNLISFPTNWNWPDSINKKSVNKEPPSPVLCSIPNCRQIKRYACSKTGRPLCSLQCYRKNVSVTR